MIACGPLDAISAATCASSARHNNVFSSKNSFTAYQKLATSICGHPHRNRLERSHISRCWACSTADNATASKPEIAGSNPATPAMNLDKSQNQAALHKVGVGMADDVEAGNLPIRTVTASPEPKIRLSVPWKNGSNKRPFECALAWWLGIQRPWWYGNCSAPASPSWRCCPHPRLTPPNPGYADAVLADPAPRPTASPLLAGEAMWQSIQLESHFVKSTMRPPVENSRCALNRV